MSPSINPTAPFYETPFIYSKTYFQPSTTLVPLTGPTDSFNDVIKSDGDSDFFARQANNLYNFNDQNGQTFITSSPTGIQIPASAIGFNMPLAPEKLYVLGADIPIQMQRVNGAIIPTVAFLSYPAANTANVNVACPSFQGVKRYRGVPNSDPGYKYREKSFTYVINFNQNWTYLLAPFTTLQVASNQTFVKNVLDFDFELQGLEFSADFTNTHAGYNGYMIKLYDANGYALMKDFVHYRNLSLNGGYTGGQTVGVPGDTQPWTPNCFPCPPVIYTKGSLIKIDVLSLLDTGSGGGGNQTIHFRGVRRIPC